MSDSSGRASTRKSAAGSILLLVDGLEPDHVALPVAVAGGDEAVPPGRGALADRRRDDVAIERAVAGQQKQAGPAEMGHVDVDAVATIAELGDPEVRIVGCVQEFGAARE